MKINQKILNLIIILSMVLSTMFFTSIECFAEKSNAAVEQSNIINNNFNDNTVNKELVRENSSNIRQTAKKTGFKDILIKFFIAMSGVFISSVAIILGLKLYKKLMLKNNLKLNNIDHDKTFDSPKDFKEAINLFLDKTNK